MRARVDGKGYICKLQTKCTQYTLTILRTVYNFCETYKSADGKRITPAQRLVRLIKYLL